MVQTKPLVKKRRLKKKKEGSKAIGKRKRVLSKSILGEEAIPDLPIDTTNDEEDVVYDINGNPRVNWLLEDRDTNQYFAKKFTTEDCLKFMKQGVSMLKYCRPGKDPHYRRFRLSDSETHMFWGAPNSIDVEKKLAIGDMVRLQKGQDSAKFQAYLANVDKVELSFSIIYAGTLTLDVICGDKRDFYIFTRGIQFLLDRYKLIQKRIQQKAKKIKMIPLNKQIEFELKLAFKKYNTASYGKEMEMPSKHFKKLLHDLNLKPEGFDLLQLCQEADPSGEGIVRYAKYRHMMQKMISQSATIEEIVNAFKVLARSNKEQLVQKEVMRDHFLNFIKSSLSADEIDAWLKEVPATDGTINYNQLAYVLSGQ